MRAFQLAGIAAIVAASAVGMAIGNRILAKQILREMDKNATAAR